MAETILRTIELREVRFSPEAIKAREAAAKKRRETTSEQLAKQLRIERITRSLRKGTR